MHENYYREDVARSTPLKKEDELALFTQYRKRRTAALRERIVRQYLYWAAEIATRYCGPRFSKQDAISAANVGLMLAINSFDPSQGRRFVTYSFFAIRKHVIASLHGTSLVNPVSAMDAAEYRHGREGTPESRQAVKREKKIIMDNCAKTYPMNTVGSQHKNRSAPPKDTPFPVDETATESNDFARPGDFEFDSVLEFVKGKLHELPRLERRVLELRYLSGTEVKYADIGAKLKISEDHARYLHGLGLQKLRELAKGEN